MHIKDISYLALAATLLAPAASAAPIFFTDEASFAAATGALSFEGFETPSPVAGSLTFDDFTVTELNGSPGITNFLANGFLNPVQEGSNAIWYDDNGDSIGQFTFNSAINALGIYITTTPGAMVTATFNGEMGVVTTGTTPTFFGVIADSLFTTIDFEATGGPNIGFDAASYGLVDVPAAVPLPATGLLLIAGLGGLAMRRKRG